MKGEISDPVPAFIRGHTVDYFPSMTGPSGSLIFGMNNPVARHLMSIPKLARDIESVIVTFSLQT